MITRIEVSNFKSFKHIDIKLGKFNVIIGPNASGKSNFVQVFKFIRDIIQFGLDNAIQMQGGIKYLQNLKIKDSEPLSFKIYLSHSFIVPLEKSESIKITDYIYGVKLKIFNNNYEIIHEQLIVNYELIKYSDTIQKENYDETESIKEKILKRGMIAFERKNGNFRLDYDHEVSILNKILSPLSDYITLLKSRESSENKELLIQYPTSIIVTELNKILRDIGIYDFESKLIKKGLSTISGKVELEEDGRNIPIVLKKIIDDNEKRRALLDLIEDILSFVKEIDIEKSNDRTLLLKLKESYFDNEMIPVSLLSDGTINVLVIIIALYFEKKKIIIFEEPERNIYPYLISRIVSHMDDASQNKQIIITTHNPEFVKWADIKNLIFIARDEDGFSKVYRPSEVIDLKAFLENDLGMDDLFIDNILEV